MGELIRRKRVVIIIAVLMLATMLLAWLQLNAIAAPPYGDANMDGQINMGDVTYIERVILELAPRNIFCDVNQDGVVDMGDVVRLERIILGIY